MPQKSALSGAFGVLTLHLVHQGLKPGWQGLGIRTEVTAQSFADGIANRRTGGAVEVHVSIAGKLAGHGRSGALVAVE
jgi:hypothetical protein